MGWGGKWGVGSGPPPAGPNRMRGLAADAESSLMTTHAHLTSRCERITLRGLTCNVRHWGAEGAPRLFMLHGRQDASPTFQFVVDALGDAFHVIAPDWRGYGQSEWLGRPYAFADYYADLEVVLTHYAGSAPVWLAGHSMGANIAANYAAARPERVARLALLDFLGLAPPAADASAQLRRWLDACAQAPQTKPYRDVAAFAERLRKANPRLDAERALFLASELTFALADGRVAMACDPWHRLPSPLLYSVDEWMSNWRRVRAPTLLLIADQGHVREQFGADDANYLRRLACFADLRVAELPASGHNVQHDCAHGVATELLAFFGAADRAAALAAERAASA